MNVTSRFLVFTILVFALTCVQAQINVAVSEPELSLRNNKIQIEYDILNTSRSEKFTIRVEITNGSGELIPAVSLDGDVGEHISGGGNKKILWDIEADSIFLDEDIFFQVIALPEKPLVAEVPPETMENADRDPAGNMGEPEVQERGATDMEDMVQDGSNEPVPEEAAEPGGSESAAESGSGKEFNRTALIAQSLALPGLGLSRATGKPHWIRGVAGYGCIAGSVYLNRAAYSTYQDYQDPETPGDVDDLFNQAQSQKTTSQILAFAAVGIWVADLVWNIVGTSDLNEQVAVKPAGLSIGTSFEPMSSVPLIALRYRF